MSHYFVHSFYSIALNACHRSSRGNAGLHSKVTRILVAMFSVNQHVSGSSTKRSVSTHLKPPEKKKLKGALVSVASKDWFTVLDAVPV